MIFALLLILGLVWGLGRFVDYDSALRAQYAFVNKFMAQYERQTGLRLTYDQALALVQVTIATMRKSQADKVYLEAGCPAAQKLAESLCEEAEWKVNMRCDK